MNCEILETLYLRSNGDVPCNDDAGERLHLGHVDARLSSLEEVVAGEPYQHIRAALRAGKVPWPGTCERCAFFRPLEPFSDSLVERRIRKIQIEASLACRLRCPGCSNAQQIRHRPKPWIFPMDVLDALLDTLVREKYSVGEFEYCGQGEPLLHPDIGSMVDRVRTALPRTKQRIITSGNANYAATIGGHAVDEIFVSCDGLTKSSYEQYRVRGDVEVALRFLADVPNQVDGISQLKVWKYILFEFNDSDEEIERAQVLAQELGVDTLLFVFTHSAMHSKRWTANTAADFPLLYPNVITSATPIHDQSRVEGRAAGPWRPLRRFGRSIAHATVDEIAVRNGRISVRGWVWQRSGLHSLEVVLGGQSLGRARLGLPRPDVHAVHPEYRTASGFQVQAEIGSISGRKELTLILEDQPHRVIRLTNQYRF